MIFVVADHGGWQKKQQLVTWLRRQKVSVVDLGPEILRPDDDYPVWAARLAREVQGHRGSVGIALCRSGIGMAVVANKFAKIRAAQVFSPAMARQAKLDEDVNIISLAADYFTLSQLQAIVRNWLKTPFTPVVRFRRRLRQISAIERGA